MSSPRFKQALFHDAAPALTLEGAIRTSCAYAGVHDFDFQDKIDEGFGSFASWTGDALGTWDTSASTLAMTGGGGALWYQARHATEVAPGFVASFDLVAGQGAFVLHGKTDASTTDGYLAFWTTTTCGFARVDNARAGTNLVVMPYGITAPARITVAVQWRLDSVDETRKWLEMSLYADGQEMCCCAEEIGGSAYDWAQDHVGFAVYSANTCTVDNLAVQELHRIVDYLSIDPNETPRQGLGRAIGTTRLELMARYDGTVRVWRPGAQASCWTVESAGRMLVWQNRSDRTKTITHARMLGAIHSTDRFDDDEGDAHMHRFVQADDPNLMSEGEVYEEAGHVIRVAQELQETGQLTMAGMPLLERHDVITYDGVDYRVVGVNTQIGVSADDKIRYVTVLAVRRYVAP